jgi:hypothetical protein
MWSIRSVYSPLQDGQGAIGVGGTLGSGSRASRGRVGFGFGFGLGLG